MQCGLGLESHESLSPPCCAVPQSFAMSNPLCVALHFMMQSSAELFGHTSHLTSPVAHTTHWLPAHTAVAQTLLHELQFFGSVAVLTHALLHTVGAAAGHTHALPEHDAPLGQVTHALPQSVCPVGHTQLVPLHTPPVGQVTHAPPHGVVPGSHVKSHPFAAEHVGLALAGAGHRLQSGPHCEGSVSLAHTGLLLH